MKYRIRNAVTILLCLSSINLFSCSKKESFPEADPFQTYLDNFKKYNDDGSYTYLGNGIVSLNENEGWIDTKGLYFNAAIEVSKTAKQESIDHDSYSPGVTMFYGFVEYPYGGSKYPDYMGADDETHFVIHYPGDKYFGYSYGTNYVYSITKKDYDKLEEAYEKVVRSIGLPNWVRYPEYEEGK